MKQIFIQNAETESALTSLREYSEANRLDINQLKTAMRTGVAVGEDPKLRLELPVNVRLVFTVEEHPSGWFRHLSVSIAHAKPPNPEIVKALMPTLGFKNGLESCHVYMEAGVAMNVMEPMV